ncbi:MAG TPA: hypothetical protein VM010_05875, partial [Chitinophagaceae bacterium]|nr:hypothetical protein [Chitinophagaceae bacterium]
MQTAIKRTLANLQFQHLPAFAAYLLNQHLEAFCRYQLDLLKSLEVPLFKSFAAYSDAQLLQLSKQNNTEFLTFLANNQARSQIDSGLKRWQENTLAQVDKYAVVAEDITYITYARKQTFLQFMPAYCADMATMIMLLE